MLSRNEIKGVALSNSSDQELTFHESKVIADTDAWSCTEGNIGRAEQQFLAQSSEMLKSQKTHVIE